MTLPLPQMATAMFAPYGLPRLTFTGIFAPLPLPSNSFSIAAVAASEGTFCPRAFNFFLTSLKKGDAFVSKVAVDDGGAESANFSSRFGGNTKEFSADVFAATLGWIPVSSVLSTLPAGAAGIAVSAGLTLLFRGAGWQHLQHLQRMAMMAQSVSSLGFSFEA